MLYSYSNCFSILFSDERSGKVCDKWTEQPGYSERDFPNADIGNNFCRNPDGSHSRPWCFSHGAPEMCNVFILLFQFSHHLEFYAQIHFKIFAVGSPLSKPYMRVEKKEFFFGNGQFSEHFFFQKN